MATMSHHGTLASLVTELEHRSRDGRDRSILRSLRRAGVPVPSEISLAEVVRADTATRSRADADALLRHLVARSIADDTAVLGVLAALRPAWVVLARRLVAAGVRPEDAQGLVLSAAFERLCELDGVPPSHVARTLVSGTWDRLRWQLVAEQRCHRRLVPIAVLEDRAGEEEASDPGDGLTRLLRDAVNAMVLSRQTACVIHASRVGGRPLREVARRLGKAEGAVRRQRSRGEQALVARARSTRSRSDTRGQGQRDR